MTHQEKLSEIGAKYLKAQHIYKKIKVVEVSQIIMKFWGVYSRSCLSSDYPTIRMGELASVHNCLLISWSSISRFSEIDVFIET